MKASDRYRPLQLVMAAYPRIAVAACEILGPPFDGPGEIDRLAAYGAGRALVHVQALSREDPYGLAMMGSELLGEAIILFATRAMERELCRRRAEASYRAAAVSLMQSLLGGRRRPGEPPLH